MTRGTSFLKGAERLQGEQLWGLAKIEPASKPISGCLAFDAFAVEQI